MEEEYHKVLVKNRGYANKLVKKATYKELAQLSDVKKGIWKLCLKAFLKDKSKIPVNLFSRTAVTGMSIASVPDPQKFMDMEIEYGKYKLIDFLSTALTDSEWVEEDVVRESLISNGIGWIKNEELDDYELYLDPKWRCEGNKKLEVLGSRTTTTETKYYLTDKKLQNE